MNRRKFGDIPIVEVFEAIDEMCNKKLNCAGGVCTKYNLFNAVKTEWEKSQQK